MPDGHQAFQKADLVSVRDSVSAEYDERAVKLESSV
jgi:polysaccharide pyruvyl transferase WcaK-like protein